MSNFLNKDNILMLWDVISDEHIFNFLSKDIQNDIYKTFLDNLKQFYDVERKNSNLVEINKKYIMLILNYIKTNYPQKIPTKIKILDEPETKNLITYEEIQNDRKSQFEKDLMKREEEW